MKELMKEEIRTEQRIGSMAEKEEKIFGRMTRWSRNKIVGGLASCTGGCSSCGCSSCGCGH